MMDPIINARIRFCGDKYDGKQSMTNPEIRFGGMAHRPVANPWRIALNWWIEESVPLTNGSPINS